MGLEGQIRLQKNMAVRIQFQKIRLPQAVMAQQAFPLGIAKALHIMEDI